MSAGEVTGVRPGDQAGPACDPYGTCITCADEALALRVRRIDAERGLALCEDDHGRLSSVEIALVEPVEIGEDLLVHAGTAIGRPE